MSPTLLSLLLAAAEPGADAATALSAAAPRALDLGAGSSLGGAAAAVTLLAALAAVALLAARRRMRPGARIVEVVETTSLGPRRALVVARVQGELLLLGASEAGISVLQTRPATAAVLGGEPAAAPLPAAPAHASPVSTLLGRLRRARPPEGDPRDPPAFDALLHESAEDLELRRKLAHGLAGSVR